LSPQGIRRVKREIRVLGVAARREAGGFLVVGVVYRGGLWLDGAIWWKAEDLEGAIAEMLKGSPHSGQVRVILLSRANLPTDVIVSVEKLSAEVGKPVILLGEGELKLKIGAERLQCSVSGLSRWVAEDVLKTVTPEGSVPEALRVAALILSGLPEPEDA
jgi:endonuclease V-like protein UPF0215 family